MTLGAGVTHAMIEDGRVPDPSRGLMPRVAASLAYRAIRTRGTIGGSLALADPAAEWPAVLAALDAEVTVCGPNGRRSLNCAEFATGIYETRLADDEIIESVRIPKLSADARWGYVKLEPQIGRVRQRARRCRRRPGGAVIAGSFSAPPTGHRWCSTRHRSRSPRAAADSATLHDAIAADLDRAADRHFDEFQRNLHRVAAMRAVQQVTA